MMEGIVFDLDLLLRWLLQHMFFAGENLAILLEEIVLNRLIHALLVLLIVLHHADLFFHDEDMLLEKSDFLALFLRLTRNFLQLLFQVMVFLPLFTDIVLQLLVIFVNLGTGVILDVFHFLNEVLHEFVHFTSHIGCLLLEGS